MYESVKSAREVAREDHARNDFVKAETSRFHQRMDCEVVSEDQFGLILSFFVCGELPQ